MQSVWSKVQRQSVFRDETRILLVESRSGCLLPGSELNLHESSKAMGKKPKFSVA